jgi:hypothetical protein
MEPTSSLSRSQDPATGPYFDQSNPVYPVVSCLFKIYFNIILPSTPVTSQAVSSLEGFRLKFCMHSSSSHVCYTPHLFHIQSVDHPEYAERYKFWSSSLWNIPRPPVTSSLLGPNILLSTLFLKTFNLCPSLMVRNQVSYSYKTKVKL